MNKVITNYYYRGDNGNIYRFSRNNSTDGTDETNISACVSSKPISNNENSEWNEPAMKNKWQWVTVSDYVYLIAIIITSLLVPFLMFSGFMETIFDYDYD